MPVTLSLVPLLLAACASDGDPLLSSLASTSDASSNRDDDDETRDATSGQPNPDDGTTGTAMGVDSGSTSGGASIEGGSSDGGANVMTVGACAVGAGTQQGVGSTMERYLSADVTRDGRNYRMITNGWGDGWLSHSVSWQGTAMAIESFDGSRQPNGAPAGYPSVFCGRYSDTSLECGLPTPLSSVTEINTAVSWSRADTGTYNVAYDVWLGNANSTGFGSLESYFMVWLQDPPVESPAGMLQETGVTVANVPGVWNIIAGSVNNRPIVNYVRAQGDEVYAMAFDMMDFIRDARARGLNFPGNDLLAIAIGFEIWQGPVTNLTLDDFCLDIQ